MDDRSRSRTRQHPPPPTHADPHARLIANEYDPPRDRQMSSHHNRNPSPATIAETPTVPSNTPLLAPRPQPHAVAIYGPQKLFKRNSSGGSSSSIQVHQVPRRNRRFIPPPQPILVPGAPDYSHSVPPPQMHDSPMAMTSYGSTVASLPSQQLVPPPYHLTAPYSSQIYKHSYSSASPPPPNVPVIGSPAAGSQMTPQGPRDFANPNHRPKVLTVSTSLGPISQGNGWTPLSSTAGSVMMMSPPYQMQQLAATTLPASYSPDPSGSPYQSHWRPYTPERLSPQQIQPVIPPPQQRMKRGYQPIGSEPPWGEFLRLLPEEPLPTTQDGYYPDARRANAEMQVNSNSGRDRELLQPPSPIPPPIQAKPPPPSQCEHAQSMSESGPGKMNASTIARMLQAQRGGRPSFVLDMDLSWSYITAPTPASSMSRPQQQVPKEKTSSHRPDSPVKPTPPAPFDQTRRLPAPLHTQAQPSAQRRVLRRDTPPLPPTEEGIAADVVIASSSPISILSATSEALPEPKLENEKEESWVQSEISHALFVDLTDPENPRRFAITDLSKKLIKWVGLDVTRFRRNHQVAYWIVDHCREIYDKINGVIDAIDEGTGEEADYAKFTQYTDAIDALEE